MQKYKPVKGTMLRSFVMTSRKCLSFSWILDVLEIPSLLLFNWKKETTLWLGVAIII